MGGDADKGADKGKFGSFKDLLRSQGGEPEPEPGGERGWTLERGDGASGDLADGTETARDRILLRPAAFGSMTHGPDVYKDIESEEMTLLGSFRVRTVFPDDVLEEVRSLPDDPDAADFEGRVDLRGEVIFTIDGDDAKDYDDAIGIKELPGGNIEFGVHIADVGHYVRPGTALDSEALARGTSVYLADQVVPMLPERAIQQPMLAGAQTRPARLLGDHGVHPRRRPGRCAGAQERDSQRAPQHLPRRAGAVRRPADDRDRGDRLPRASR